MLLAETYTCSLKGSSVPLFCISCNVRSGFLSQNALPYSHCRGKYNSYFVRSTSGATSANLLTASMAPVPCPLCFSRGKMPGFMVDPLMQQSNTLSAQPVHRNRNLFLLDININVCNFTVCKYWTLGIILPGGFLDNSCFLHSYHITIFLLKFSFHLCCCNNQIIFA